MFPTASFTSGGSARLESCLKELCLRAGEEARALVKPGKLEALLLGGGYGRGEGGVLRRAGEAEDAPYNDMEFFVFLEGPVLLNDRRHRAAFEALGHRLTEVIGIEVEFKILSLARLRASATTMFYYDLANGHRMVPCGGTADEAAVAAACAPHLDAAGIPPHEAARLLLNRSSGLLYAAEKLSAADFDTEAADFTARNLAKARLALGDVALAARGRYHWSCVERHRRLMEEEGALLPAEAPGLPVARLQEWHREGVEFKLRPTLSRESREALAERHRELKAGAWAVWSWLEQKRLGRPAGEPGAYAAEPGDKCPETNALKNALVRLRAFGPAAWSRDLLGGRAARYPREALFRALPLLLWKDGPLSPADLALAGSLLHSPARDRREAVNAYEALWRRFN